MKSTLRVPSTIIPLTPSRGPRIVDQTEGGNAMPKKKKEETIEDILDRIEEDIQKIRQKTEEDQWDDMVEDEDEDEE